MFIWSLFSVATGAGIAACIVLGLLHAFVLIWLLEYNRRIAGTVLTVATIAAVVLLGNTGMFAWVAAHWLQALAYVVGYLLVGPVVATCKWFSRARRGAERWFEELYLWLKNGIKAEIERRQAAIDQEMKERKWDRNAAQVKAYGYVRLTDEEVAKLKQEIKDIQTAVKAKDLTPESKPYFEQYIKNLESSSGKLYHCPDVDDPGSLGLWVSWFSFWPWVLAWTVLNDPLRRLGRHIYYAMRGILQKISVYAWQRVHDKLKGVEEAAKAALKAQAEGAKQAAMATEQAEPGASLQN